MTCASSFRVLISLPCLLAAMVSTVRAGTPQTITFPEIADQLTTAAPFALGATASSGLDVTYAIVSTAGVAAESAGSLSLTGTAGAVTIKASQPGDGTFDPAPEVIRTFLVWDAAQRFVTLARGPTAVHSVGIRADGTLWAWGDNEFGQLGDGTVTNRSSPVQVGTATTWVSAASGYYHTLAVRSDGTLWAWGYNDAGQLGDGTTTNRSSPVQVGSDTTWASVACGTSFSVAVRTDGTLWAWGLNNLGQLGLGDLANRSSPVQVGSATDWAEPACGGFHTLALRTGGTLWAWGQNNFGQLGDGTTTNRSSPVQVGSDTTWATAACGQSHTVALRADGTLWVWGRNSEYQLGLGDGTSRSSPVLLGGSWSMVSCGFFFTAGLRSDGTLWTWGNNDAGQLGLGDTSPRSSPAQVGSASTWASVACGGYQTLALQSSGTLWGWGQNAYGQLGDGTTTAQPHSPVQVGNGASWASVACGAYHTLALRTDGTLWAWGYNYDGQLGDGTTTNRSAPVQVGSATTWASVACGYYHTLALRTDGTLWAWGNNDYGQLGNGEHGDGFMTKHSAPEQVGSATTWASVACGAYHTLALRTGGTLWAWGSNVSGQLGDGFTTDRSAPAQMSSATTWTSVACGGSHTIGRLTYGTLWAWGYNYYGELGDGTTTNRSAPVQVGSATTWASVACGGAHTLALRTDGTLWAWGYNYDGQLGDGTTTSRSSPVQVGSATTWASVAGGSNQTLAVRTDGTLWAWGSNDYGQLGDGTTTSRSSPVQVGSATNWVSVACGKYHTLALRTDGTLWAWGLNNSGQLGDINPSLPRRPWPQRAMQMLDFPAPATLVPGESATLTASASSGLPVLYTVDGPATVNGTTLTATGLGTVTVRAYQQGDSAWLAAETATQVLEVVPELPHIALFGNGQAITGGDVTPSTADGTDFGTVITIGSPVTHVFTINNSGNASLTLGAVTIGGSQAAEFAVALAPAATVAPGGSTMCQIQFSPAGGGLRSATLSFDSDDPNNNPFNFAIQGTGRVLLTTDDSDDDGLNDVAEFKMSALGFDWQVAQPDLVNDYYSSASSAGLYTTGQVQALNVGTPLIQRDPATDQFTLTISLQKSADLSSFSPFPMNGSGMSTLIDGQGRMQFQFTVPDNAAFFRLQSQ